MMAIHPLGTTLDFSILLDGFWDKTLRQSHFGGSSVAMPRDNAT